MDALPKLLSGSTYVFLDIETIGLKPESGKIIELAALKVKDGHLREKYVTFVNPGQAIPLKTSRLTGITDRDVKTAPTIGKVLTEFLLFVRLHPLIAHNAPFDVGFLNFNLQQNGHPPLKNSILDTMELACILMPIIKGGYGLESLATELGIDVKEVHRAEQDCLTLISIFKGLLHRLAKLPLELLAEINYLLADIDWSSKNLFQQAVLIVKREEAREPKPFNLVSLLKKMPLPPKVDEGIREDRRNSLDLKEVLELFKKGGPLSRTKSNFEERREQMEMAEEVTKAFNLNRHLVIEAGTGIGKSLAYLAPAALWIRENQEKVVISTHTKVLQDQLYFQDIPLLEKALGTNFNTSVLKGRTNYICLRRWERFYEEFKLQGSLFNSNQQLLGILALLVWLTETTTGDIDELPKRLQVYLPPRFLGRLIADKETCLGDKCLFNSLCFVNRARQRARRADLVIINHSLLLSDSILPPFKYLIVDEAHHLENVATEALTQEISLSELKSLLLEIYQEGQRSCLVERVKFFLQDNREDSSEVSLIASLVTGAFERLEAFFSQVKFLRIEEGEADLFSDYRYSQKFRIDRRIKKSKGWTALKGEGENLKFSLETLNRHLKALREKIRMIKEEGDKKREIEDDINNYITLIDKMLEILHFIFEELDGNYICWVEIIPGIKDKGSVTFEDIELKSVQVNMGRELLQRIFEPLGVVVLTSATLTIGNPADPFKFIKKRLGFDLLPPERISYRQVDSPFNFAHQVKFFIPTDLQEFEAIKKSREQYFISVSELLKRLLLAVQGRALVLFTAHEDIDQVYPQVCDYLEKNGLQTLRQERGTSTRKVIEQFKEDIDSVLFGTYSLWEGIDVPGEALQCLVIAKLPFEHPQDPVLQARMEELDEIEGYDGRYDYYYPLAILKLRQGLGRLIRKKDDYGVIIVLDKRFLTKEYSQMFRNSLPKGMEVNLCPSEEIVMAAKGWLEKKRRGEMGKRK